MARIRTVKPEICTSEQFVECTRDARLLFVLMWNFCDDGGVHPASERRLKMEVFPADDLTTDNIRRMIDELLAIGLLIEYEVKSKKYWRVTGWHHQRIERPTYKYPLENGAVPKNAAEYRRSIGDRSPPEWNGEEWNGVEGNGGDIDRRTPPDGFAPIQTTLDQIKAAGKVIDHMLEVPKFIAHYTERPKRFPCDDWQAAYVSWCLKAFDRSKTVTSTPGGRAPGGATVDQWLEKDGEEENAASG